MRWWRVLKRRVAIEFPDEPETAVHAINNLTYTLHTKLEDPQSYEANRRLEVQEMTAISLNRIAGALEALVVEQEKN